MVDSILIMSQAEKKDFFDEAAGIKEFQIKRDDALNKLKRTEDNQNQAEVLLTEISPRLRSLTRQVKRLERREEIEKNLREIQTDYYAKIWHGLDNDYAGQNKKYLELEEKKKTGEAKIKEIELGLNKFQKLATRSEAFDELQKEYQNLLNEKSGVRELEIGLKNEIQILEQTKSTTLHQVSLEEVVQELEALGSLFETVKNESAINKLKELVLSLEEKITILIDKVKNPKIKESNENKEKATKLKTNLEEIKENLSEIEGKIKNVQEKIANFNKEEEEKNKELFDLQKQFQTEQYEFNELVSRANEFKVELARLETKKEDLEIEIKEELDSLEPIKSNKKNLNGFDAEAGLDEIHKMKHQLELIGGIDPEVQKEFGETKERHDFLFEQVKDLKESLKSLEQVIHDLDDQIKKQFDRSFGAINSEFQKYFKMLFRGGNATLIKITAKDKEQEKTEAEKAMEKMQAEQADPTANPESEDEDEPNKKSVFEKLKVATIAGIEIQATPPGKKLKTISMLSGGERAMTAIALICAIISCNPSPFIVLDEVDAALDEANSERFASILDELSHKTQFVIVTHNRATMHRAKILYGITMGDDGVSKLLSLKLEEAEKYER